VHRAARISHVWRIAIMDGRGTPTTDIAFRVAKVLDVSLYDVLAGTALPPGTCTHCGRLGCGARFLGYAGCQRTQGAATQLAKIAEN